MAVINFLREQYTKSLPSILEQKHYFLSGECWVHVACVDSDGTQYSADHRRNEERDPEGFLAASLHFRIGRFLKLVDELLAEGHRQRVRNLIEAFSIGQLGMELHALRAKIAFHAQNGMGNRAPYHAAVVRTMAKLRREGDASWSKTEAILTRLSLDKVRLKKKSGRAPIRATMQSYISRHRAELIAEVKTVCGS